MRLGRLGQTCSIDTHTGWWSGIVRERKDVSFCLDTLGARRCDKSNCVSLSRSHIFSSAANRSQLVPSLITSRGQTTSSATLLSSSSSRWKRSSDFPIRYRRLTEPSKSIDTHLFAKLTIKGLIDSDFLHCYPLDWVLIDDAKRQTIRHKGNDSNKKKILVTHRIDGWRFQKDFSFFFFYSWSIF